MTSTATVIQRASPTVAATTAATEAASKPTTPLAIAARPARPLIAPA